MRTLFGAALALLLAACSPQAQDTAPASQPALAEGQRHKLSGLEVIPLTISHDGSTSRFKVEVARSDKEWQRGLMFRTEMGEDEGMIFVGRPPQATAFWMKNTVIPLDIIFIAADGTIINIAANAEPYSLTPRESFGLAAAVLEINGGGAAKLGIGPGAVVKW